MGTFLANTWWQIFHFSIQIVSGGVTDILVLLCTQRSPKHCGLYSIQVRGQPIGVNVQKRNINCLFYSGAFKWFLFAVCHQPENISLKGLISAG